MASGKAPKAHIESGQTRDEAPQQVVDRTAEERPLDAVAAQAEEPSPAAEPQEATEAQAASPLKGLSAWLAKTFPGNEHAAMGGVLGLIVAIAFFVAGFWKTLFVMLLVVAGVALGQFLDGDPKIVNLIRRLFSEGRGN